MRVALLQKHLFEHPFSWCLPVFCLLVFVVGLSSLIEPELRDKRARGWWAKCPVELLLPIRIAGLLLPVGLAILVTPKSISQECAVQAIEDAVGAVVFDEESPERPVINVKFQQFTLNTRCLGQRNGDVVAMLPYLKALRQLQTLDLLSVHISDAEVGELQQELPNVKILFRQRWRSADRVTGGT